MTRYAKDSEAPGDLYDEIRDLFAGNRELGFVRTLDALEIKGESNWLVLVLLCHLLVNKADAIIGIRREGATSAAARWKTSPASSPLIPSSTARPSLLWMSFTRIAARKNSTVRPIGASDSDRFCRAEKIT